MALVSNGVQVRVNSDDLPSGYTPATVTGFSDYEYQTQSQTVTVVKSTVENATASTTVDNIVADIKSQLDTQMGADFDDTANTVTVFYVWKSYTTNLVVGSDLFTNAVINYLCNVDIYVKVS